MKNIVYKIRKYGIVGSFKITVRIILIYLRSWLYKIPWQLRPKFYYNLLRLIFMPSPKKRRILGIYDLKVSPWDVGDPLVFVENLSVLRIENKAEEVDICIIYDRDYPNYREKNSPVCNITIENAQDYILESLPLFSTCPYLGSVYQFNSRKEFYRFLKINLQRYDVFPFLGEHLGEKDILGLPVYNPMQGFYDSYGYIPHLRIGGRDSAWAQWFYSNHLPKGALPVTVSLKKTLHRVESNAAPEAWLSFIDRCKLDFPEIVFVIVGLREEVFEGLRNSPNVIIAKDFGTSIIEDLALIRASLMYMGTNSGVNAIAMFSNLPYLITQYEVSTYARHGLKPGDNYSFMLDTQKIFSVEIKVTPEFLFKEFKAIYSKLNKDKWHKTALEKARNKHGHPTAQVETVA